MAGFTRAIILCQASKSQLHKLCLILIVPTLFFLILCLSLAQACKLSSESTHGSQEHLREDVAGGLLRSRLKIELNSHEAPKNSEISLSLRHKCLENQTLLVLLMAETPSLSRIQVLKDPAWSYILQVQSAACTQLREPPFWWRRDVELFPLYSSDTELREDEVRSYKVMGINTSAPIATVMWLNPTFTASTLTGFAVLGLHRYFTWNLAIELHIFMV